MPLGFLKAQDALDAMVVESVLELAELAPDGECQVVVAPAKPWSMLGIAISSRLWRAEVSFTSQSTTDEPPDVPGAQPFLWR